MSVSYNFGTVPVCRLLQERRCLASQYVLPKTHTSSTSTSLANLETNMEGPTSGQEPNCFADTIDTARQTSSINHNSTQFTQHNHANSNASYLSTDTDGSASTNDYRTMYDQPYAHPESRGRGYPFLRTESVKHLKTLTSHFGLKGQRIKRNFYLPLDATLCDQSWEWYFLVYSFWSDAIWVLEQARSPNYPTLRRS